MLNLATIIKNRKKHYRKGLPTMIAECVGCSAKYVSNVLDGKHDNRDTESVRRIREKAFEIEKIMNK